MDTQSPSLIKPVDLRLRLVAAFFTLLIFTAITQLGPAIVGLLAAALLLLIFRQRIHWARLLHLEGFLLVLLCTLPFTVAGEPLFHVGPWVATAEGMQRTIVLMCKITASVLLVSGLFASTETMALGVALRDLYVPEVLVRLFVSVVRYLGLIRAELHRLLEAMRARGFRPKSNWHTWRSYGYLSGMLLVRALERAERVEEAMVLRGYRGHFPKSQSAKPGRYDYVIACLFPLGALMLLLWDRL